MDYYRYEIALRYFPDSPPDAARKKLTNWINRNKHLLSALNECGYSAKSKTYNRRQIELIYHYLGEP